MYGAVLVISIQHILIKLIPDGDVEPLHHAECTQWRQICAVDCTWPSHLNLDCIPPSPMFWLEQSLIYYRS